jgi:hypothetical protein
MRYKIPLKGLYLSGVLTAVFITQQNKKGCPNTVPETTFFESTNEEYDIFWKVMGFRGTVLPPSSGFKSKTSE